MAEDTAEGLKDAIRVNEQLRGPIEQVVRSSVEETSNALLQADADQICKAGRYQRSAERVDTRAGHYDRKLETKAGAVVLKQFAFAERRAASERWMQRVMRHEGAPRGTHAGRPADKWLKGAKPGDLPIVTNALRDSYNQRQNRQGARYRDSAVCGDASGQGNRMNGRAPRDQPDKTLLPDGPSVDGVSS